MRRTIKIVAWTAGVLLVLPFVVLAIAITVANMDWGRRLVERTSAQLTGGHVMLTGLSGRFPEDLRIARVELHDDQGLWLSAQDIAVQWSPVRLWHKALHVERLHADRIELLRASAPSSRDKDRAFELPLQIDIDRFDVNRVDIGAPVAGAAASVALQGSVHAASLQQAEGALSVKRIDAPGSYELRGRIDPVYMKAELDVTEPAQGLLAGLAKLPDLGALSIQASAEGPRNAEAMRLAVAAGPLRAGGQGKLDLVGRSLDVDLTASAPAMTPRPDVSWDSVSLQAHIHGPFTGPDATGQVHVEGLKVGDAQLRSLSADLQGNRGAVGLHAVVERLRIPGANPDLFQAAPLDVRADARLDDPARPVTFAVAHPLMSVQGTAKTGGDVSAALTIIVPSLTPFAAIAGADLKGHTTLNGNIAMHGRAMRVDVDGIVGVTGGQAPVPALIGDGAKVGVTATLEGDEIGIERAQLDGRTLRASVNGSRNRGVLDLQWKVAVSDLAVLAATVSGQIDAQGRVRGSPDNLNVVADATGDVATQGFPRGPIKLSARLQGLPGAPSGHVDAGGRVNGAPLELALAVQRNRDGSLHGTIERADWKSAHVEGDVSLRVGDRLPQGRVVLRVARLEDLQPWIGRALQGSVVANVDLVQSAGRAQAKVQLEARNAGVPGAQVERLNLSGRIDDPTTRPLVALQLAADGIASNGMTGAARLEANGTQDALKLKLNSDLHNLGGDDARVAATATLNATARQISFSALQAEYKGQTAQLLAPARISFRDGIIVERLRVGVQQAVLEIAGRVSPALDATASLRNVTPALAKTFMPDLEADGTMTIDARLRGTTAEPRGTVRVNATGLRMRTGPARSLPAANLIATADLNAESARIEARLSGGSQIRFDARGQVPLAANGPIDVHASGTVDAAIANPILEAGGRRVKGQVTLDVAVTGTRSAPQVNGEARLAQGEIQDYALGAHLTNIDASLRASGDTIQITNMTARAGAGTVSASGTFGILASGGPVDVKLTARNAKPLASDLVTATMDADVTLRGQAQTRLDAAGRIRINHADITIPNALPPTVAVLDVRRPGQTPAAPSARPTTVIGLDVTVDAPRAVFVRGRGLDAEVGGELHIGGTSAAPRISGGLDMRRGTFDLAGTSLKFTSGKVDFTGTGLTQKIDPTLDFVAETTSGGITAKLGVTGYADAPKITLTSTPELPQDEVLARLLFGVSVKQLSALQIAQIGSALATLSGVGGGGVNPLMAVQKSLGLDRLAVGGTSTGGASVEAGRYVSERVYVGAKQTTTGATQAQVQVDLTKHLKVQATLGVGGTAQGATPDNDPGSSIGLSYQFEY